MPANALLRLIVVAALAIFLWTFLAGSSSIFSETDTSENELRESQSQRETTGHHSKASAKPPNTVKKLTHFRYLHVPKTGTSFIIALRNYLDACPVKHFTCPGQGGGAMKVNGHAKPFVFQGVREDDMARTQKCNGSLRVCGEHHDPWVKAWESEGPGGEPANVVTLLRRPIDRLVSQWNWARFSVGTPATLGAYKTFIENCIANPNDSNTAKSCPTWTMDRGYASAAIKMLAGYRAEDIDVAINETLLEVASKRLYGPMMKFIGITELWTQTICTFHCELGGEVHASEYLNTRANGLFGELGGGENNKNQLTEKARARLEEATRLENRLYDEARKKFEARARACGCM